MRVLIADDSAAVRERLETMLLELQGVEVIGQAGDAVEATKSILELKPDVVILDIRMPGGGGIDTLRSIKRVAPAPRVIMLTNYPYPQYRKRCMDAGADFFFDKSSEFQRVSEVLKQMMQDGWA